MKQPINKQRIIKTFISNLQTQLISKIKNFTNFTNESVVQICLDILRVSNYFPSNENKNCINKESILMSQFNQNNFQAGKIITRYQQRILDLEEQIKYLKRQRQIQFQMTKNFFKIIQSKNQKDPVIERSYSTQLKRSNIIMNNDQISLDTKFTQSIVNLSQGPLNNDLQYNCISSSKYSILDRSSLKKSRSIYLTSQFSKNFEADENLKQKALIKLRKLQKFVFQKQPRLESRKKSKNTIYNLKLSPSKQFYKEQNNNLKTVQQNLNTHLEIMQKFRDIPSLPLLVSKEQTLKKKEKNIKQLEQLLLQKQTKLNKKYTEILKKEKSIKKF